MARCPGSRGIAALLVVLLISTIPGHGLAESRESLGVTPARLEVPMAQRGETYVRVVTIQNQFDSPTNVTVEVLGDGTEWVTSHPNGTLNVGPREEARVELRVHVPEDAPNGDHTKQVRFSAASKGSPDGSGFALQYAVTVPVNVSVGGEQIVRLEWTGARTENVEAGTPPGLTAWVTNKGNVRTIAGAVAEVLAFTEDTLLGHTEATVEVLPGATAALPLVFPDALPEGQYRIRVRDVDASTGFEETLEFKVLPPGSLEKEGLLRYLDHEPRVEAGYPVKVSAVFENTGAALLGRVKFKGEVYEGGRLVAVLESDERVVPVGDTVRLDTFFTPKDGGDHRIVGVVHYDGFETLPNEGLLFVRGEQPGTNKGGIPGPGAAAVLVALGLVGLGLRRR